MLLKPTAAIAYMHYTITEPPSLYYLLHILLSCNTFSVVMVTSVLPIYGDINRKRKVSVHMHILEDYT